MPIALPLTPQQFQNEIVVSGGFGGGPGGPILRTQTGANFAPGMTDTHLLLNDQTVVSYVAGGQHAQSQGSLVSFRPDNGVNRAVYLPFFANNCASAIVPAGVNHFFTDALSGCAIFIDLMPNGDLLVHHGNAMAQTPNMAAILANPAIGRADSIAYMGAMNHMVQLHNNAMGQRAAGLVGAIQPQAHLQRNTYMQCIDDEIDRKEAQGRTDVTAVGAGTNVVGFRIGGLWQFWWQTWAVITYRRPGIAPKGWFGNRNKGIGAGKLLDAQCFWHQ